MQKFEIFLKNEKIKTYRLVTLLIVVLHFLFFMFLLFGEQWQKGIAGLTLIALYSLYRLIATKTTDQKFYFGEGFFFVFMIFGVVMWVFIFDAVFFALSGYAFRKIGFDFERSFIRQKNFPFKKYEWSEIDNVIMKDSMLTIDLKNNKLIQGETENEVNEEEFNNFAKQQLQ